MCACVYILNPKFQVHLAPGSKFDFQKYIKRSLEDDFKVIVGISPTLWASALIFLFLNVNGWHTMLWISIMPVVIILSVGTKLQGIICRMAIEITERHAVIQGIPLVKVSDSYFWFARPTFVLFLIHFTLFQNGFQIIYFLWILVITYTSSYLAIPIYIYSDNRIALITSMSTGWTLASTSPTSSSLQDSALELWFSSCAATSPSHSTPSSLRYGATN
jgi:hypothetical protein